MFLGFTFKSGHLPELLREKGLPVKCIVYRAWRKVEPTRRLLCILDVEGVIFIDRNGERSSISADE